jgi:hypothetical protein
MGRTLSGIRIEVKRLLQLQSTCDFNVHAVESDPTVTRIVCKLGLLENFILEHGEAADSSITYWELLRGTIALPDYSSAGKCFVVLYLHQITSVVQWHAAMKCRGTYILYLR